MKAATYMNSPKTHTTDDSKHTLCGLPVWKTLPVYKFFIDTERCGSCQNIVIARLENEGVRV